MSSRRVRVVVIVRCPLCGAWIASDGQTGHVVSHHAAGSPPSLEAADGGPDDWPVDDVESGPALPAGPDLGPPADRALELLAELGYRRANGESCALGFEIFQR